MRIFFFLLFFIICSNVLAETYVCEYKDLNKIKKFTFERITHSHFKMCEDDKCEDQKLSVIFADNNNLIIGDIINKDKVNENFLLFIIDNNKKLFSLTNISLPHQDIKKQTLTGKCVKK